MLDASFEATKLAQDSPRIYCEYIKALNATSQFDKTIELTTKAMKNADFVEWLLPYKAEALARKNLVEESDKLFEKAISDAKANKLGGIFLRIKNAYPNRKTRLAKVIAWSKLRADDSEYYYQLAIFFQALDGRGEEGQVNWDKPDGMKKAQLLLTKAITLTDDPVVKAKYYSMLGPIYYEMKDFKNSELAYLAALDRRPKDLSVLNNLAYLYVENLNLPDKALPYAKKAVDYSPTNSNILDTYGWALAKSGQYKLALKEMEKAVRKSDSPTATLQYHLGYVYHNLKDYNSALRQYRLALRQVKQDDPLKGVLENAIQTVKQLQDNAAGSGK